MPLPIPIPIPICHHGSRYSRHALLLLLLVASRSSSGFRHASFISIGTAPRYGTVLSGQKHGMRNIGQSRRRKRFAMTTTSTPPEEGSHSQEEGIQVELELNEDEHLHPKNGDSDSGSNDDSKSQNQKCIYLDNNGTTPIQVGKRVLQAMMPYFTTHFGNPSSAHYYGQEPKEESVTHGPTNNEVLRIAFYSFLGFTLLQTSFAVHAKSSAMIADSEAMFIDAGTYLCNLLAEKLKNRPLSLEEKLLSPLLLHHKRKLQRLYLELFPPAISVCTLLYVTFITLESSTETLYYP